VLNFLRDLWDPSRSTLDGGSYCYVVGLLDWTECLRKWYALKAKDEGSLRMRWPKLQTGSQSRFMFLLLDVCRNTDRGQFLTTAITI